MGIFFIRPLQMGVISHYYTHNIHLPPTQAAQYIVLLKIPLQNIGLNTQYTLKLYHSSTIFIGVNLYILGISKWG